MNHRTVTALACATLAGCTYTGHVRDDFYKPTERPRAKIKLTVGIAQTQKNKDFAFKCGGGGHSVDIGTSPAIAKAISLELAGIFENVKVLEGASCPECDIVVFHEYAWKNKYRDSFAGNYGFDTSLTLSLKGKGDFVIATISASDEMMYSTPPGAIFMSILTGGSLFLLSPITIPATTGFIGIHAEDLLEENLTHLVSQVGEQASANGALGETAVRALAGTGGAPQVAQATSKYDDFMKAVVVIRGSNSIGTGFFISKDGSIVTNKHVVGNESSVSVRLQSGQTLIGSVVLTAEHEDLAVVKVSGDNFNWLSLEEEGESPVGSDVIAIGTPEGLSWSVTKGIVSARRQLDDVGVVQTDAAINSGNSGGPLISLATGKVIGVNTFMIRKSVAEGLNFAVASPSMRKVVAKYLQ